MGFPFCVQGGSKEQEVLTLPPFAFSARGLYNAVSFIQ